MEESTSSVHKNISTLILQIEEKKSQYKQKRRPILWYIFLAATVLIITIMAGLGSYLFSAFLGILGLTSFIFGIGFLSLIPAFFSHSAFDGTRRITTLMLIKSELERLQTQLKYLDAYQTLQCSPQERYKDELTQTILQYKHQANSYRRTHYLFQLMIMLLSLFVTALTSGLASLIGLTDKQWITAGVSFAVSFLTAMTALFRFHDRGFNLQQTADAIEYEIKNAELRIYDYSPPLSDEEVLRKLAERGTRFIDEQRKRQLQLEQASNTKPTAE